MITNLGWIVIVAIMAAIGYLAYNWGRVTEQLNINEEHEVEKERLMAMACVSSGQCRRTPEQYQDILFKKMLDRENERHAEECTDEDCKDCEPKDCVCGNEKFKMPCNTCTKDSISCEISKFPSTISCAFYEFDGTGADIEEVLRANKEAAASVQDINHAKALERCERTKKAIQKSIGMTDDEIEAVNGRLD